MARKTSRQLVIDTCVAQAAGGEEATDPRSKNCRDFLQSVLTVCHRVVIPDAILAEWKEHRSRFTHRWLVEMFARKKASTPVIEPDGDLRRRIEVAANDSDDCAIIFKDLPLVECAMVTGKAVISVDETVRELLDRAARTVGELRQVEWVNPDNDAEAALSWLEEGAPSGKQRTLGFRSPAQTE